MDEFPHPRAEIYAVVRLLVRPLLGKVRNWNGGAEVNTGTGYISVMDLHLDENLALGIFLFASTFLLRFRNNCKNKRYRKIPEVIN